MPHAKCEPSLSKWTCDPCKVKLKQEEKVKLKEKEKAEYRKHNNLQNVYAKMVDLYYRSGKKYREVFYIKIIIRDDKPVGISVQTRSGRVILQQLGEINEALLELAFSATKSEVDRLSNSAAKIDDREWLPWVTGKKYFAPDTIQYPFFYRWDGDARKWVEQEQQTIDSEITTPKETLISPLEAATITTKEGICIHCGQLTTDWWEFDSATKQCRCRKCYREGKY